MQVNILDAKNRLSQLVKAAQAGEEVVIANRGKPMVRLVVAMPTGAGASPAGNVAEWLARRPVPAHAKRSASAIDAALAQERAAWD